MSIHLTERNKEVLTGLFAIVLFFGGFLVGEVVLRMVNLNKFGTATGNVEASAFYYKDESTGLRLQVPDAVQGNTVINSLGYRSPEIPLPNPERNIRIAFLGTSTTHDGYTTSNATTWPNRTVEELRVLFPDCSFDYVNAGIAGFSVGAIEKYFQHYVHLTEPDLTLIYALDVNSALKSYARENNFPGPFRLTPSWLAQYSLLWEKIEKNLDIVKLQRAAFEETGKLQVNDMNAVTKVYATDLTNLTRLTQGYGATGLITGGSRVSANQSREEQIEAVQTTLYFIPYVSLPTLLKAFDSFNKTIEKVAMNESAIYIDGHEQIPSDLYHYVDSVHFTDQGSAAMGKRISEKLANSTQFLQTLRQKGDCISD